MMNLSSNQIKQKKTIKKVGGQNRQKNVVEDGGNARFFVWP